VDIVYLGTAVNVPQLAAQPAVQMGSFARGPTD